MESKFRSQSYEVKVMESKLWIICCEFVNSL
jgi:hypothetical protein